MKADLSSRGTVGGLILRIISPIHHILNRVYIFFPVPFSFDEESSNTAQKEVHDYGFINYHSPSCRGYSILDLCLSFFIVKHSLIALILPDIPLGTSTNSECSYLPLQGS